MAKLTSRTLEVFINNFIKVLKKEVEKIGNEPIKQLANINKLLIVTDKLTF